MADRQGEAKPASLSERTHDKIKEMLAHNGDGTRRIGRLRGFFFTAGPAVIAAIAYVDPGNYSTNIQAGAGYGYALLWVVLLANLVAMLFQALSAKLGIVTGANLAELCRDSFSKPVVWAMWAVSEVAAMATDLAEFLGGAIGLSLLFHLPLLAGMGITAVITYALLMLDRRGFRPLELVIGLFLLTIALCFLVEMLIAPVDWRQAGQGLLTPYIPDTQALLISVGIIGATVMPHAIYLHSGLTQSRVRAENDSEKAKLIRFSNREVAVALSLAGMVNMAMLIMAASAFHQGHSEVAEIENAYHILTPLLGGAAAAAFLISLLVSGISSSMVGTMAGQMIMQGFVGFHIPIWLRRLITMIPAFIVAGLGVDTTAALVVSQVVLSLALPAPMLALLVFTRRRALMGRFANGLFLQCLAGLAAFAVLFLNIILVVQTFGISLPFIDN